MWAQQAELPKRPEGMKILRICNDGTQNNLSFLQKWSFTSSALIIFYLWWAGDLSSIFPTTLCHRKNCFTDDQCRHHQNTLENSQSYRKLMQHKYRLLMSLLQEFWSALTSWSNVSFLEAHWGAGGWDGTWTVEGCRWWF